MALVERDDMEFDSPEDMACVAEQMIRASMDRMEIQDVVRLSVTCVGVSEPGLRTSAPTRNAAQCRPRLRAGTRRSAATQIPTATPNRPTTRDGRIGSPRSSAPKIDAVIGFTVTVRATMVGETVPSAKLHR
jgi:hypothetical protein